MLSSACLLIPIFSIVTPGWALADFFCREIRSEARGSRVLPSYTQVDQDAKLNIGQNPKIPGTVANEISAARNQVMDALDKIHKVTRFMPGFDFVWGVDGALRIHQQYLNRQVGGAFPGGLDVWLAKRQFTGSPIRHLDVFGSTPLDGSGSIPVTDYFAGIRLSTQSAHLQKQLGRMGKEARLVEGDAFLQETWEKLNSQIDQDQISHFDAITIAPLAGFGPALEVLKNQGHFSPTTAIEFQVRYFEVVARAYKLLSADSGVLVFQVNISPDAFDIQGAEVWKNFLISKGFLVNYVDSDLVGVPLKHTWMTIEKSKSSPESLPLLNLANADDSNQSKDRIKLRFVVPL